LPAHVPIGKEATVDLAEELLDVAALDGAALDELAIDALRVQPVLFRVRLVELVERDLESGVVLAMLAVVAFAAFTSMGVPCMSSAQMNATSRPSARSART